MRRILLIGVLLCISGPTFAIYKCESGGKITYSDTACPDGKTIDVDSTEPADAAQARKRAAAEKKQLNRVETERRKLDVKEEREQRRAARANATQQKQCARLARRQQLANEDARSATGKTAARAKTKARRATEQYEEECGGQNRPLLGISG